MVRDTKERPVRASPNYIACFVTCDLVATRTRVKLVFISRASPNYIACFVDLHAGQTVLPARRQSCLARYTDASSSSSPRLTKYILVVRTVSRVAEFLACFGVDFILSNAVAGLRILLLRIHGAVSINTALAPDVTPILPVSLAPILIEARRVHVPVRLPLCLFFTVEPLALVQALRST